MKNLTRYKMETRECNNWDCDKVDAWPDKDGEWIKYSDVKELLQTAPNITSTPCSTCGGSGMSVVWNFCPECGRKLWRIAH
jgi:hypothetical protein